MEPRALAASTPSDDAPLTPPEWLNEDANPYAASPGSPVALEAPLALAAGDEGPVLDLADGVVEADGAVVVADDAPDIRDAAVDRLAAILDEVQESGGAARPRRGRPRKGLRVEEEFRVARGRLTAR